MCILESTLLSILFVTEYTLLLHQKKCSALIENLISKKYPMFLVGLSYFLLSYGANIMKKIGSAKLNFNHFSLPQL